MSLRAGAASFTVLASGTSPLSYQWQKNQANLSNGGHYSGCTTGTLTITNVDKHRRGQLPLRGDQCLRERDQQPRDLGPAERSLHLPPFCSTAVSRARPTRSEVGTNWVGYQRAPNPTTVWSIQTASPPTGGGLQYQQIANTSSTGGGGVRQDVTGCAIGATYQISGWMRGNSMSYSTCTVKVSPTASTNWSTAINLNPPQTYTGNSWVAFSGTVVATWTNMTLWLDGQTTSTGLNKAECFDAVTVTCVAPAPQVYFTSVGILAQNQVQLVVSSAPGQCYDSAIE